MKKAKNIFLFSLALMYLQACAQTSKQNPQPKTNKLNPMTQVLDTITLGSGCFWCTEAIYQRLEGVISVTSGYAGGHVDNPSYDAVCEGTTGHAEVCQIVYDTTKVSIDEILMVFWKTHDPTTLNQQGNDVGPQYRSAIFYHNNEQKEKAMYYKKELDASGSFNKPIVTEITAYTNFFSAEQYHQNYYNQNKSQGYCRFVIGPKLEKFEKVFSEKLKKQ